MISRKLSIIVPVYNAGNFLNDCIKSIFDGVSLYNRNLIEVILIDDCSTDESLQIARHWANKFPNIIKLIQHQTNQGPGGARNTGFSHATGEYFVCIDADDWYAPDAIDKLLSVLPLAKNEILIFEYKALKNGKEIWRINNPLNGNITGHEALYLFSIGKIVPSVFNKILPAEMAKQIPFTINAYYEDIEFTANVLNAATTVRFLNESLLIYRGDGTSITRQQIRPKHINDLNRIIHSLFDTIEDQEIASNIFLDRWYRVLIAARQWGLNRTILIMVMESIVRHMRQHDLVVSNRETAIQLREMLTSLCQPYEVDYLVAELHSKISVWLEHYTTPLGPFFSIVIPVFNAGRHIPRVVENFASQQFFDFEIIFVNDQSTDNSRDIILEYTRQYDFIKYLELPESSGAGVARNCGLQAARGKYILFHDSDDWFDPNGLQTLRIHIAENHEPDLVLFSFSVYDENDNFLWASSKIEDLDESLNTGDRIFEELCASNVNPSPWNKAFKQSVWIENNIQFPPEIHHQDLATIPYACFKARSVSILKSRLYNYCTNLLGVTRSATDKHVYSPFRAIEVLFNRFRRESTELFDAWREHLMSLAFETFRYNFKLRKDLFMDNQVADYIGHFNSFCIDNKIDFVYVLNCLPAFDLMKMFITEKTKRGLTMEISCFSDHSSFEKLIEHYAILENQFNLTLKAVQQGLHPQ